MNYTQETFYKSKEWEAFRKVIIEERTDADGYVHCSVCGKPIVKKYDLIVHHKIELSDANVNNAKISLNPENVECICFSCHNKVHDKSGHGNNGWKPQEKKVYIVYGAPCAGKSTWVSSVASQEDLVVDMDSIWQMVSTNARYTKPAALKSVVFELQNKLYDIIKFRSGKWCNAFVITGGAMLGDRERLKQRIGATELVYIEASHEVCVERLKQRVKQMQMTEDQYGQWLGFINQWFERYQPDK